MGLIVALVLGLVTGAIVGRAAAWYRAGSDGPGIIASIIGALIILARPRPAGDRSVA